jgi:uncharacterized protein YbjT (DUF2867 family)
MVGQGVLHECLAASDVEEVISLGRSKIASQNPKLISLQTSDLWNFENLENELKNLNACFFCLGTPSAGKSEAEYSKVTYDLTMAAAQTLARLNPSMTFIYVSGQGADSSEQGPVMWARVRGKLENALLRLSFKAVFILRPGMIIPMNGIESKTDLYRWIYRFARPLLVLLRPAFKEHISSTDQIGQVMLKLVRQGDSAKILGPRDFERLIPAKKISETSVF